MHLQTQRDVEFTVGGRPFAVDDGTFATWQTERAVGDHDRNTRHPRGPSTRSSSLRLSL